MPGTVDIGNHCDDCGTTVALPFTFNFYGTNYTSATLTSNGYILFNPLDPLGVYNENTYCVPSTIFAGAVMYPSWSDGYTLGAGLGIFTSTTGSSPNRVFNIEYRNAYYPGAGGSASYEVKLYEGMTQFDFVYGSATNNWNSSVGCQSAGGGASTSVQCNLAMPAAGTVLRFDCPASFPPSCSLSASPNTGTTGTTFLATSNVIPGAGPASTGIVVSLDATQVNGGTVALFDDGPGGGHGDVTAGDHIYSNHVTVGPGAGGGADTLTSTVSDAQNRSSTCTTTFTVSFGNDDCGGAIPAVLGSNNFDNSSATTSTPAAPCGALGSDLWYTFSNSTGGQVTVTTCGGSSADTAIAAYDGCGGPVLACNDDFCGLESSISFCAQPNHTYMLRIGGFAGDIWSGTFNVSIGAGGGSPTVVGSASPACTTAGSTVTLMARVTSAGCPAQPVISATANATSIGGPASVTLHDDGAFPDTLAGDGTFSGSATVAAGTSGGAHTIPMTVTFSSGPVSTSATVSVGTAYTAPANCTSEGESCGINNPDTTDGGCNSTPYTFGAAQLCRTYCGTGANSTTFRDTDWYTFYLPQADTITVTGQAQFAAQWFILASTCPAVILSPVANNTCGADLTLTYSAGPGTYVFFCSPALFDGLAACGNNENYWFNITTASGQGCGWPVGIGRATPSSVSNCGDQNTLLTVRVTPGTSPPSSGVTVTGDLTSIGGSSTQTFFDNATHGDAVAGDGIYSFQTLISYTTPTGIQSIPFTINDAQGRTFPATLGVNITACTQLGACCADGGCSFVSGPACAGQNGSFQGVGTTCGSSTYAFGPNNGQFVDISGTGTLDSVTTGCDDCTSNVALPFAFNFFGSTYNDVNICSNGNLQFGTTPAANFVNDNPPSVAAPNNAIYPCWDDLYVTTGGIYYQTDGAAPNRTFTVAWINRTQFVTGPPETFECVLHETSNNIDFLYGDMPADAGGEQGPGGSDYTIGVENSDGTIAYTILGADIGTGHTARTLTFTAGVNPCTQTFCCLNDYNGDGDVGTDADIEAFFACLAGNCCATCPPNADFNCDGDVGTDADIESFFRVLAGGIC